MQIVFLLKDDYEKHSENAVGKGLKAPTRQNISAAIQKIEKGDRNLPEINQLCIVYEISSTLRATLPEPRHGFGADRPAGRERPRARQTRHGHL